MIKWLILIPFYLLYWGICILGTGTDKKNLASLESYPDEVQLCVKEKFPETASKKRSVPASLIGNFLLFTVIFSILGVIFKNVLNLEGYLPAFLYFLAFGEGLGLFDLVVIDLLWWRNSKRIRFSFLPEKEPYQNPSKHVASFLRGIPIFAAAAALAALIVTVL